MKHRQIIAGTMALGFLYMLTGCAAQAPKNSSPSQAVFSQEERKQVEDFGMQLDKLTSELEEVLSLEASVDCKKICSLTKRICELSQNICKISKRHAGDEPTKKRCIDSLQRCQRSQKRVEGPCNCQQGAQ